MFKFIFKTIRLALLTMLGTAIVAKFMLKSNAKEETQEIDLVTIFGGENLVSSADPFYGGKILTMYGGTVLDLRKATPAPTGIYIDVLVWMGGVNLVVPKGWRVDFTGKVIFGGFDDATQTTADPDAPMVRIGGMILFGGLQATTKSPLEVVGR
ncbi:MAG: LiaF domain-containing protein [Acidimicrobiia bacterium]